MAMDLEKFIQQLEESSLIAADVLRDFIPPKAFPRDTEELACELIRQKLLTRFQADQISTGNGKSLTLGNYVLMEKIGAGGMGQVFKARHRRMDRLVAVKLLPDSKMQNKVAIARFEREVKAAAKLRHPNIVAADDADQANGVHFLVMELVEGSNLSDFVRKHGPLPVDQAVNCIVQAARGLEFAHEQKVVHRDIKPANLLIDARGTVKILDMGLARIEEESGSGEELTNTGAVMGTVDYMAPEQALNTKQADARSDIYSLGISLWYLLTGSRLYDGDSMMSRLLAHRDSPIPSLHELRSEVPEWVDAVFQKMVAKKPQDRYQTMTEVIAELEGFLGGTGSSSSLRISISTGNSVSDGLPRSSSRTSRLSLSAETDFSPQATATYVPSADRMTEATLLSVAQNGPRSAGHSVWWSDHRVQIGAGIGVLLLILAIVLLSTGTKNGLTNTSHIASTDASSVTTSDKNTLPSALTDKDTAVPSIVVPPPAIAPFDAMQARKHQKTWAKYLGTPVEKEIELRDGTKIVFMLIPPGEFMMGSAHEEQTMILEEAKAANDIWVVNHISNEGPQHRVRISKPFYLGKYELTQAQWHSVMGTNPSDFKDSPLLPVENISWDDIQGFLARLNESDGETHFDLPTEGQWEYACRAGTSTPWNFGDTENMVTEFGWIKANSGDITHPVGQKYPNGFGLFDMHGNVWEWCADWHSANSYSLSSVDDPQGFATGFARVNRGGCWGHHAIVGRSAYRGQSSPDERNHFIGFRLGMTINTAKWQSASIFPP